jgi:hypothetical protein
MEIVLFAENKDHKNKRDTVRYIKKAVGELSKRRWNYTDTNGKKKEKNPGKMHLHVADKRVATPKSGMSFLNSGIHEVFWDVTPYSPRDICHRL